MEEATYTHNRLGYQITIGDLERLLNEQGNSVTAVKKIVEQIFAASSLVTSIIGALGVLRAPVSPNHIVIYNILIVTAMLLYFLLLTLAIWVLQPIKFHSGISTDWDELYEGYISHTDDNKVLMQRVKNLLEAIQQNEPIIAWRRKRAQIVSVIFPFIILLLFVLGMIRN